MRIRIKSLINVLILFAGIFCTSCNNIFSDTVLEEVQPQEEENDTTQSESSKTGHVKIKVQAETQQIARSIIPIVDVDNLTNISITGHKEGQTVAVGSYSNLTQLTNADIELDLGYWTLSITAENDGFGFTAEREVNIVLGPTTTVNFTLSPITSGGGFSIPLEFTGTAAKVTYNLTQFPSGTSVDSGNLTISSNHVVCEKDFNHVISAGTYQVEISFYGDNEQTVLLNKYSPLVTVKNGFMSRPVDENNIPTTPHIDLNQMYTITYDNAGGTLVSGAVQVNKYSIRSSTITLPELEKTGYIFAGWYDESGATVTTIAAGSTGNVELTAQWTPRTDTAYKVEHYKQNITDDDYTLAVTDNMTGTTDASTEAAAKDVSSTSGGFYGFLTPTFSQSVIAPDGSTVVRIYYDRKTFNVTYNDHLTTEEIPVPSDLNSYRYGATVTVLFPDTEPRTGYTLSGWTYAVTTLTRSSNTFVITSNSVLEAVWSANTNTAYTVKHLQQNTTGSEYTEVTADRQNLTGTTAELTDAAAKTYIGFTAQTFTQETIAADGSTIVEIRYDRHTYSVTYNKGTATESITLPSVQTGVRYGANVNVDFTTSVTRTGWTFAGWKNASTTYTSTGTTSFTMPDSAVTLTAQWTANTDTAYTVKHLQQNTTGSEYTEVTADRQNLTGTTDGLTNAAAKPYTGFTAQTFTQETIAADGSTIVEIRYDRRTYSVTYNDGVTSETINVPSTQTGVRYDASVNVSFTPAMTRTGYTFAGWSDGTNTYTSSGTASFPMPNENVILTAIWTPVNNSITFEINGGSWLMGYTPQADYTIESSAISLPTSSNIGKNGYSFDGWYTSSTFTAGTEATTISSGSTGNKTFYAKWTPVTYTISYIVNGGSFYYAYTKPSSYTVESPATLPTSTNITKTGYIFDGWYESSTFSGSAVTATNSTTTGNKTYYAKWTATSYTISYTVNGGTFSSSYTKPSTYTIESPAITLPTASNITRSGFAFGGWYTTSTFTGDAQTTIPNGSTGNKTYYANWIENVNVDEVLSQIENAGANAEIVISGALSTTDFANICSKIKAKTTTLKLDLSGVVGITTLTSSHLSGATKLKSLKLPETLTTIQALALNNIGSNMTPFEITIPASVTSIADQTFFNGFYSAIKVDSGNQYFSSYNGDLYDKDCKTFKEHAYKGYTSVTVKTGTEVIASQAFAGKSSVTSITLPASLKTIKANAFANISSAWNITIQSLSSTLTFKANSFNQNNHTGYAKTINYNGTLEHFVSHTVFETNWNSNCSNDTNQFVFTDQTMSWSEFMTYYNEHH